MMTDSERIKENVERGKAISSIVSLAMGEATRFKDPREFWTVLVKQIESIGGIEIDRPVNGVMPMNEKEFRKFGREQMPFGKYYGKPMHEVPLDYLEWFADLPLQSKIRRYLASSKIKAEREVLDEVEASETN